jgi:hypothetical protein
MSAMGDMQLSNWSLDLTWRKQKLPSAEWHPLVVMSWTSGPAWDSAGERGLDAG